MEMYLPPPGAGPSRRELLKKGLVGSALLALFGGGWLWSRRTAQVPLAPGLQVLDAQQYAVVWTLVQRFVPPREGFPSPDALGTAAAVDGILAKLDVTAQAEVLQVLGLVENALPNFLLGGRVTPFTRLSPPEQDEVLEEWRTSRLALRRSGWGALRKLCMAAYYADPRCWAAAGWEGPPKGVHEPDAPVWKGGGQPRPPGRGTWVERPPGQETAAPGEATPTTPGAEAPAATDAPDAGVAP